MLKTVRSVNMHLVYVDKLMNGLLSLFFLPSKSVNVNYKLIQAFSGRLTSLIVCHRFTI